MSVHPIDAALGSFVDEVMGRAELGATFRKEIAPFRPGADTQHAHPATTTGDPPSGHPASGDALSGRLSRTSPATTNLQDRPWPEPPGAAAYAGLAGRIVETLDPHTEADPVAVLATTLVAAGVAIGPGPHCRVGATRHSPREYAVCSGATSKARKGDSAQAALEVFRRADPDWTAKRVVSGLSSGEGVIWAVRDEIKSLEPVRERGKPTRYELVVSDPGEADKRLLIQESEFARALGVMTRQRNTLSAVLRQAWDTGDLRILTKTSPARATGAGVGILAHITGEELTREMADVETVNGFANRFLFFAVKRSKFLPEPDPVSDEVLDTLAADLRETLARARTISVIERSPEAKELWAAIYPDLSADRPGLVGALTARAEAHCLRLSALYALLDRSATIEVWHLQSALELWGYVDRSVRYIFGDATGDPVADTIARSLAQNGEMSRSSIVDLFARHQPAGRIDHALQLLLTSGKAKVVTRQTGGRPAEVWTCG